MCLALVSLSVPLGFGSHGACPGAQLAVLDRYVQFLSGLLAGTVKMNAAPLFLHFVVLHGTPTFDAGGGECPTRPCQEPCPHTGQACALSVPDWTEPSAWGGAACSSGAGL